MRYKREFNLDLKPKDFYRQGFENLREINPLREINSLRLTL